MSDYTPAVDEAIDVKAQELLDAFGDRDGDDELVRLEKLTAIRALAYVVGANFKAAETAAKDGVFSLSLKLTFDRNEEPTLVKAVSRCSKISTHDVELLCKED